MRVVAHWSSVLGLDVERNHLVTMFALGVKSNPGLVLVFEVEMRSWLCLLASIYLAFEDCQPIAKQTPTNGLL